jgi:hypothetical protein
MCPLSVLYVYQHHAEYSTVQDLLDWAYAEFGTLYVKGFRCGFDTNQKVDLQRKPKIYRQGFADAKKLKEWIIENPRMVTT